MGDSLRAQGMSRLDNFLGTTSKNDEYAQLAEKGKHEVEGGMARLRGPPSGAAGASGAGQKPGPQNAGSGDGVADNDARRPSNVTGAQFDQGVSANPGGDQGYGKSGATHPNNGAGYDQDNSTSTHGGGNQSRAGTGTTGNVGGTDSSDGGGGGNTGPSVGGNKGYAGGNGYGGGGSAYDEQNVRRGAGKPGYQDANNEMRGGVGYAADAKGHTGYDTGSQQRGIGLKEGGEDPSLSGSQNPAQSRPTGIGSPAWSNRSERGSPPPSGVSVYKSSSGLTQSPGTIQTPQAPPELPPRDQRANDDGSQQMYG